METFDLDTGATAWILTSAALVLEDGRVFRGTASGVKNR